jgi:aspartate/methionine/tyrosine aminotransferase
MNRIFAARGPTIFDDMSRRAQAAGAINLGQGFPEDDGPLALREAAARALIDGPNQYPPMRGTPDLRAAIAAHYAAHQGVGLDPAREIVVTSGATEALAASCLALLNDGDEAVIFEPAYDAYRPLIERAGGRVRAVRLAPPDWRIPPGALEEACGPRTRLILVNTPLNPAAAMLHPDDVARIAAVALAHEAVVVSDEVWEHVTFDGLAHSTWLAAPGLRERTIKIGSAGKLFGMTGWKVGWTCGAAPLVEMVLKAHQFLTFTTPPNLQTAAAEGLAYPQAFFDAQRAALQRSRDRLVDALESGGFATLPSAGSYFVAIDLAASGIDVDDATFCTRAVDEAGVAAIPFSAFYGIDASAPPERRLVRLCFAKRDETLDRGAERLIAARRLFA